jgi:hypothetical protein
MRQTGTSVVMYAAVAGMFVLLVACGDPVLAPDRTGHEGSELTEITPLPDAPPPSGHRTTIRIDYGTHVEELEIGALSVHDVVGLQHSELAGSPGHDRLLLSGFSPSIRMAARVSGALAPGTFSIGSMDALRDIWPDWDGDAVFVNVTRISGLDCHQTRIGSVAGELIIDSLSVAPSVSSDPAGWVAGRIEARVRVVHRRGRLEYTRQPVAVFCPGDEEWSGGTDGTLTASFRVPVTRSVIGHGELELTRDAVTTRFERSYVEMMLERGPRLVAWRRIADGDVTHDVLSVRLNVAAHTLEAGVSYPITAITPDAERETAGAPGLVSACGFAGELTGLVPPSMAGWASSWCATAGTLTVERVVRGAFGFVEAQVDLHADVWAATLKDGYNEYIRTDEKLRVRARFTAPL